MKQIILALLILSLALALVLARQPIRTAGAYTTLARATLTPLPATPTPYKPAPRESFFYYTNMPLVLR